MAFNTNNYVKQSTKPYSNRLTDQVVASATFGLPSETREIARQTIMSMIQAGATYSLSAQVAASRAHNVVSASDDEFFFAAGKDPTRLSRLSLQSIRQQNLGLNDHLENVLPATRIGKRRQDDTVEIMVVV